MHHAMTARERFLTALTGGVPDRVPILDYLFSQPLYQAILGHTPVAYNNVDAIALTLALELDAVWVGTGGAGGPAPTVAPDGSYINEWGVTRKADPAAWPIDAPRRYPLHTMADLAHYAPPPLALDRRITATADAVRQVDKRVAVMGTALGPVQGAYGLVGMEEFALLLYDDPAFVARLMRLNNDFYIPLALAQVEAGVDGIIISDDIGMNDKPLVPPRLFREVCLPYFAEMVAALKATGAPVMLHCCGNINVLLPDLIATGIAAWQPLQRTAGVDLGETKRAVGGQIALHGNVDSARTLVWGTPEDAERETLECLRAGAPGGGYILGSDHSFHGGIPVPNLLRLLETAKRYGAYPLCLPPP
jgi:uroporphyrinogen decarboxylase